MIVQDIEFMLKDGRRGLIREIGSGRIPTDQRDPG